MHSVHELVLAGQRCLKRQRLLHTKRSDFTVGIRKMCRSLPDAGSNSGQGSDRNFVASIETGCAGVFKDLRGSRGAIERFDAVDGGEQKAIVESAEAS